METIKFRMSGAGFYYLAFPVVTGVSRIYLCLNSSIPTTLCGREATSSQAVATAFRVPCNLGHASRKPSSSSRDFLSQFWKLRHWSTPKLLVVVEVSLTAFHLFFLCTSEAGVKRHSTEERCFCYPVACFPFSVCFRFFFLFKKSVLSHPSCSLPQVVALKASEMQ